MSTDTLITLAGTTALACAPDGPKICGGGRHRRDRCRAGPRRRAGGAAGPPARPSSSSRCVTGVAGEVVQKFVNYRLRLAVVGGISGHVTRSTALRDFVVEANRGRQLWFVDTPAELEERLRVEALRQDAGGRQSGRAVCWDVRGSNRAVTDRTSSRDRSPLAMLRRPFLAALLAAFAAVPLTLLVGLVAAPPARPAAATPVRIMPLGDSITGSPGCWRALLWNRLQPTGYTNIDFVGTLGRAGLRRRRTTATTRATAASWSPTSPTRTSCPAGWPRPSPDIVLMHFGTNDVWSNIAPATILAAYSTLVDQMRASNPAMKILVAKIIPMAPTSCAECPPADGRPQQRDPGLGRGEDHRRRRRSRWSTSGPASAPPPTPTTACTRTTPATRRCPTGGTRRWSPPSAGPPRPPRPPRRSAPPPHHPDGQPHRWSDRVAHGRPADHVAARRGGLHRQLPDHQPVAGRSPG